MPLGARVAGRDEFVADFADAASADATIAAAAEFDAAEDAAPDDDNDDAEDARNVDGDRNMSGRTCSRGVKVLRLVLFKLLPPPPGGGSEVVFALENEVDFADSVCGGVRMQRGACAVTGTVADEDVCPEDALESDASNTPIAIGVWFAS